MGVCAALHWLKKSLHSMSKYSGNNELSEHASSFLPIMLCMAALSRCGCKNSRGRRTRSSRSYSAGTDVVPRGDSWQKSPCSALSTP